MQSPSKPCAAILETMSAGIRSARSQSRRCGTISRRQNSRAASRTASCSWVRLKSITHTLYPVLISQGARPKPGKDVTSVRQEKVTKRVADQARSGGPRSPFQDLAIAEPRRRVFSIRRIDDKSGKWKEGGRGPLPDIADHLAAAQGSVSGRIRSHINTPQHP